MSDMMTHGAWIGTTGAKNCKLLVLPCTSPEGSRPGIREAAEQKGFGHFPFAFFAWEAVSWSVCKLFLQQQHVIPAQQHRYGASLLIDTAPVAQVCMARRAG